MLFIRILQKFSVATFKQVFSIWVYKINIQEITCTSAGPRRVRGLGQMIFKGPFSVIRIRKYLDILTYVGNFLDI